MAYSVRHTIETDVDSFWKLFLDMSVARAMLEDLGNPGNVEVVEERVDEGGAMHWLVEYTANVELPGFIKKLVGDGSYSEIGCFDTVRKTYSARCVPKVNAERFSTTFEISAQSVGDGTRCERVIAVENTVKVFGLGTVVESYLERVQRDAHTRSADFLNRWVRSNGVP